MTKIGYHKNRQIFSVQEAILVDYLLKTASMYFRMTPSDIRSFAYDLAVRYDVQISRNWFVNKKADKDWFIAFMKRHPRISIRQPEVTSLGRAMNFNKPNVDAFFKKLFDHMIRDGPPGCVGRSNGSGRMTAEDCLEFMKHFAKHTMASKNNWKLLLLHNHVSHLSVAVIDYAKENYITMLSFPPLTSHKLQPLDTSIYGPFKRYLQAA